MEKTILVTGGAGYVGSNLVGTLLNQSYRVVVVDSLLFGAESLLSVWRHPNFTFYKKDVTDRAGLERVFRAHNLDAVVHLAAIVGDPACAKAPARARSVNLDGSKNVLELSMRSGVGRFVFASTCSNYGKMVDSNSLVDETSALKPVSLYAELKVAVEQLILEEIPRNNGFCPTVLRFATVYGVSPRMRFDLTVNEFTKELALGRTLEVFGEQFWRPYCHVADFARAITLVLAADAEKVAYAVYNVGDTRENYQKQMIVDEIRTVIPTASVNYVHRDEDSRDYRVSFAKIERELGFSISKCVPDGIREVKELLDLGVFTNPDDSKYRNS